ncbi:hypothetical protein HPB51_000252 [Rhipicephalus microplus]|uniref:Uncharacterized protein n=1 Tax=Rhipicephalus microplus TaxID=6941 RepID=A0A9J6D3I1_RHIMP|nr:hypothetical protein HPB51_000252 [Rhipicephalus microplus]
MVNCRTVQQQWLGGGQDEQVLQDSAWRAKRRWILQSLRAFLATMASDTKPTMPESSKAFQVMSKMAARYGNGILFCLGTGFVPQNGSRIARPALVLGLQSDFKRWMQKAMRKQRGLCASKDRQFSPQPNKTVELFGPAAVLAPVIWHQVSAEAVVSAETTFASVLRATEDAIYEAGARSVEEAKRMKALGNRLSQGSPRSVLPGGRA